MNSLPAATFTRLGGAILYGLSGLIIGGVSITVGLFLTSTIIGAVLGIPLALAGVITIVAMPMVGAMKGIHE